MKRAGPGLWGALGLLILLPACTREEAERFWAFFLIFVAMVLITNLLHWVLIACGVGLALVSHRWPSRRARLASVLMGALNLAWGFLVLLHAFPLLDQNMSVATPLLSIGVGIWGLFAARPSAAEESS